MKKVIKPIKESDYMMPVENDAGTTIDVDARTVDKVEELPPDEQSDYAIIWIGDVPVRTAENVWDIVSRVKAETGKKVPVILLEKEGPEDPEDKGLNVNPEDAPTA